MGKCLKRTMGKRVKSYNSSFYMTREKAVSNIFNILDGQEKFDIKKAIDTISLFGISAEELSEAGLAYENLKALGFILN